MSLAWVGLLLAQPAMSAEEGEGALRALAETTELNADLKSFWMGSFPYEHVLMPEEPQASGAVDGRLRLKLDLGDLFRLEAHHAVTGTTGAMEMGMGAAFGVGLDAPQALDLDWEGVSSEGMLITGRTDRLRVESTLGPTEWSVGRQPVSFGQGRFFAPLDLVNPFTPTTVDSEYKPGVDAARVDVYPSASTQFTAVGAYAGDWTREQMVFAGYGQVTVGVADVGVFYGSIRGDHVGGISGWWSVGPVGMYADVVGTLPADSDEDAFLRAVLGADHRLTETTSVGVEVYYQSLGESEPADYLEFATGERFSRGELWTMGRTYAGLSVFQEVTPLVMASVVALGNLEDGSALLSPSLSLSVAGNADVILGGFLGLGERPRNVELADVIAGNAGIRSEFGFYPSTLFVQTRAYF
ncbi:MAG: hypothetical protein VX519_05260 [Myxococcota bacterium]|nr:hypothetical protein [Myxococcota bacterium]